MFRGRRIMTLEMSGSGWAGRGASSGEDAESLWALLLYEMGSACLPWRRDHGVRRSVGSFMTSLLEPPQHISLALFSRLAREVLV